METNKRENIFQLLWAYTGFRWGNEGVWKWTKMLLMSIAVLGVATLRIPYYFLRWVIGCISLVILWLIVIVMEDILLPISFFIKWSLVKFNQFINWSWGNGDE